MESATTDPDANTRQIGFVEGTVTVATGTSNVIDINLTPPRKSQEDEDENEDD